MLGSPFFVVLLVRHYGPALVIKYLADIHFSLLECSEVGYHVIDHAAQSLLRRGIKMKNGNEVL